MGHAYHGQQGQLLPLIRAAALALLIASPALAQSVRDHIRLGGDRSTTITESQATEMTLTVTAVAVRPIQVWLRTAGTIRPDRTVSAFVPPSEASLVKAGQRVRAFPPESRASMFQATVSRVAPQGDGAAVLVTLSAPPREGSSRYVLEIVADAGEFLSVPNEAIIESGAKRLVYVQQEPGRYLPREIEAGLQGELYTQILKGVKTGEQVVTFGSFFIDADYKLKGP